MSEEPELRAVHPVEQESYRRLAQRIDLSHLEPLARAVVARVIHATADTSFAETLVVDEQSAAHGARAIAAGAPVITDVEMVRAGIKGSLCFLDAARIARSEGADLGPTLSALAMRLAAKAHPDGAIFAVGCAPTALEELVDLVEQERLRPALVIGVPVGFVGAAESKERLRACRAGLASISNVGERGGSPVAAAIVNAIGRWGR
ncbi:MAG: precorrin-8X methylmutase [Acidimicrobiales bacterium]